MWQWSCAIEAEAAAAKPTFAAMPSQPNSSARINLSSSQNPGHLTAWLQVNVLLQRDRASVVFVAIDEELVQLPRVQVALELRADFLHVDLVVLVQVEIDEILLVLGQLGLGRSLLSGRRQAQAASKQRAAKER
eukprot:CAMPEP_0183505734 /NCGR_PEP_ID=MMETSP0371-20130417/6868_1 /TAXON_ID=268820 /ORGANISM="Peridinium aciculiferum, Strain PAER-2" /LENGTH=133 /DNA_ID=CAMNT_0025701479 /DNA_START=85 /DNA_END=487 /DNA_ORIENTATION=-